MRQLEAKKPLLSSSMSRGGIRNLAMFTELEGEPPDVVMFGAAEDC